MNERINAGVTLREAIDEANSARALLKITDPYERAAAIADWVRREYPVSWKQNSIQDAAARAVGVPNQRELERMVVEAEDINLSKRLNFGGELQKLGFYLMGGSGLLLVGNNWKGSLALGILGTTCVLIAQKPLDKKDEVVYNDLERKDRHARNETEGGVHSQGSGRDLLPW